jgi:predicted ATP-grasp superfamily ATP-dependent carboligase
MYRVLFGEKPDWAELIGSRLDRCCYEARFSNLAGGEPLDAYDCVVPLLEEQYAPLRALPAGARQNFLIPNHSAEAIASDKLETIRFLSAAGFGRNFPEVFISSVYYPYVYKRRTGGFGEQVELVFTLEQQRRLLESCVDQDCYFKQRYVEGTREYTAHFIAVNGEVAFAKCYWFDFGENYFIKGRRFPHRETGHAAMPFPILFSDILTKLDYSGTCCFNFKIEDGCPLIFEINPRFGGSLCRDINAYLKAYLRALRVTTSRY